MKINHLIKTITDCNGVPRPILGSEKSVVNSTEKAPLLMVLTNDSRKRHGSSTPPSKQKPKPWACDNCQVRIEQRDGRVTRGQLRVRSTGSTSCAERLGTGRSHRRGSSSRKAPSGNQTMAGRLASMKGSRKGDQGQMCEPSLPRQACSVSFLAQGEAFQGS